MNLHSLQVAINLLLNKLTMLLWASPDGLPRPGMIESLVNSAYPAAISCSVRAMIVSWEYRARSINFAL